MATCQEVAKWRVVAIPRVRAENGLVRGLVISAALAMALGSMMLVGSVAARGVSAVTKKHAIPAPGARVDINQASVAELMQVPGMTSSWAGRIVRFRPYQSKTDLLQRGVLPSAVYDRIKDYVVAHRVKK